MLWWPLLRMRDGSNWLKRNCVVCHEHIDIDWMKTGTHIFTMINVKVETNKWSGSVEFDFDNFMIVIVSYHNSFSTNWNLKRTKKLSPSLLEPATNAKKHARNYPVSNMGTLDSLDNDHFSSVEGVFIYRIRTNVL